MSEAVTLTKLTMLTLIVSEESLARDVIRDVERIDLSDHGVGGDFCWVCFFSFVLFHAFRSFHLHLMLSKSSVKLLRSFGPKGGRSLLVSPPTPPPLSGISGLPFDYIFLSALLLFCLVLLLLRLLYFLRSVQSPAYFPEISLNSFSRDGLFLSLHLILGGFCFFSGLEMISWSVLLLSV